MQRVKTKKEQRPSGVSAAVISEEDKKMRGKRELLIVLILYCFKSSDEELKLKEINTNNSVS